MKSIMLRVALLALPLASVIACESSSSSPAPTVGPDASSPFTPDASASETAAPPPPAEPTATTTTLTAAPLAAVAGQEVTFTVTVAGQTPTGTVQLKDGATNLGAPVALTTTGTTGTATIKSALTTAGSHAISAAYAGDADDAASTSAATTLTIAYATSMPFGTGLDATRTALADVALDKNWTVKNAAGGALPAYAQTDALGFVGYWLPPSATSKFISPFIDTVDPGVGPFTYTTTFTLRTGAVLATTTLGVSYASDNATDAIQLNGTAVADVEAGGYGAFVTRVLTGPFIEGTNTISFVSSNSGGPTGFRAELLLTTE